MTVRNRHTYGPRVVGQEAYDEFKAIEKVGGHKYGSRVTDPEWKPGQKEQPRPRRAPEPTGFVPSLQQSISSLEKELQQVTALATLDTLFEQEKSGAARKGVYSLLDKRRQELLGAQAISVHSLNEALNRSVEELDEYIALELGRPLPRTEALELFRSFEVASKNRIEMLEMLDLALERLRQRQEEADVQARLQQAEALFPVAN